MGDLKVWVDGKERVIRGVSEETTCESVVLVLAKAAGKTGKVALLEKCRDFERILPRNENPLKSLQAWGTHKKDVCLVLRDDVSQDKTIDESINSNNDSIDTKHDLIKRSVDCESLENITAVQERKLKGLSRALEIIDFQLNCWDEDDEKFLYLTEDEIIEDFSLKLSKAVKLQAKEIEELNSLQTELEKVRLNHEKSASKFEFYSDKISQLESEIEDTYDVVRRLLVQIENTEHDVLSLDVSSDIQNEIRVLQFELQEQKRLSVKQDTELVAIENSLSELTEAFQHKTNDIELLQNEILSEEEFYDLDEHFRPLSPEEEPSFNRQPLSIASVENKLSRGLDNETISEAFPEVNSGSNGSQVEDDTAVDLSRRSSTGSPEEFFRNWSSSTRLAYSPLNYSPLEKVKWRGKDGLSSISSKSEKDSQISMEEENGKRAGETAGNVKMKGRSIDGWSSFSPKSETNSLVSMEEEYGNVVGKVKLQFSGGTNRISTEKSLELKRTKAVSSLQNGNNYGTSSSSGKENLPISRIQNKVSLEKSKDTASLDYSFSATSSATQENSDISFQNGETISTSSLSFPFTENPVMEIKLPKEMKLHSSGKTLSSAPLIKDESKNEVSKTLSKPSTTPKPLKNNFSTSGFPRENLKLNPVFQEQKKTNVPPATLPKPQKKSSSGSQMPSRSGALSSLSNPIPNKAYLLPPTVQHKRDHHRKEKALSHEDLCEEGVFV